MPVPASELRINWNNKQEVIGLCRKMSNMSAVALVVVKYPSRPNYNIVHATNIQPGVKLVWQPAG